MGGEKIMNMEKWSLKGYNPRPEQEKIIDEILTAINKGYENIILEAGTGVGKSAIATTIANYFETTYICTMTNQLQEQYLHDFKDMLKEIKGRSNYPCNYDGSCEPCNINEQYQKMLESYSIALKKHKQNPGKYAAPEKPKKPKKCGDCPYNQAIQEALLSPAIITNYDYLYYAGNFAQALPERDLLILDETHNFEKKVMQLVTVTLNRKTIKKDYDFDIFDGLEHGLTLKKMEGPLYWIGVCEKLINETKIQFTRYINETYGGRENMSISDSFNDDTLNHYERKINQFGELRKQLKDNSLIIEIPTKKEIQQDDYHIGLKAEFKPLMIKDYSETLLHFGGTRLFMTGTLGNKEKFCYWIGLNPEKTYYIYVKSPFPRKNRPIIRDYVGNMKRGNWKNINGLNKIEEILDKHKNEKGVIHVSSNQQAWWLKQELSTTHKIMIAGGKDRSKFIEQFEKSRKPTILIGAGVKDGVDFKGDKCRFQILYKMPFPSLAGKQINIRKKYDLSWYMYQTIMPLMQAYGRGIRDMDDYCITYVLDADFESLLSNYRYLFNEYFLEAIDGLSVTRKRRKVKIPIGK